MADANLKIPSEERIRFNASESIINAVSPRVDISTIPGGHRMTVTDIDGVETADIMDGVKGDTGDAAGFGTVSASVDANVGTPSVTVTSSGPNTAKNFDISFKNLKGNTGDAAGFGTVSASVDANVGTPSVTVTSSGPNTAKNFDISFKNLKGVKGDTGDAAGFDTPTASVDGYIGTPSVAVTATGPATAKKFDFAFHNLKGEKGDTGSIESLIVDGTEPEEGAGVSVDGPISELSAEGWAEQFSTSGKNLVEVQFTGTQGPYNGIRYTSNDDGSITVAGTSTGNSDISIYNANAADSRYHLYVPNGTYTLSASGLDNKVHAIISGGGRNGFPYIDHTTDGSWTGTVTDDSKPFNYVILRVDSGITVNTRVYLQLEAGSTATEYEPYTGGAPSPSPDYPQEIEVAKGRNLLDYRSCIGLGSRDGTDSVFSGSASYSDGVLTVSRSYAEGGGILKGIGRLTVKAGETVVLSADIRCNSDHAFIGFGNYSGGGTNNTENIYLAANVWTNISRVLTTSEDYDIGIFMQPYNVGATLEIKNLQLEFGSITTPYIPYGYVGMEVQGKNLLPPNIGSLRDGGRTEHAGVTFRRSNNVFTVSGTATEKYPQTVICGWSDTFNLDVGKTYTISVERESLPSGGRLYPVIYENEEPSYTGMKWLVDTPVANSATFTVTKPYTHMIIVAEGNGVTWSGQTVSVQIEEGSTATEYEPYHHTTTPIPLPSRGWVGSLPDGTADKLSIDGAGKVEWEEKCDEATFDGIEYLYRFPYMNTEKSVGVLFWKYGPQAKRPANMYKKDNLIADRFPCITHAANFYGDVYYGITLLQNNTVDIGMRIPDTNIETNEQLAAWLSTHPVTVLYPLATPVTESLGYIDLPDIPAGSTVTIPELDALGISYYVDNGAIRKLAEQYKARLEATSFADIEDAVTELAAEVQKNTNRTQLYLGYDTVNGKQMISVFKRNV